MGRKKREIILNQISIVYTENPNLLMKLFSKELKRSNYIKETIDYIKLSNLTKLQIGNINSYLKRERLFIRISVMGHNGWEVWYN